MGARVDDHGDATVTIRPPDTFAAEVTGAGDTLAGTFLASVAMRGVYGEEPSQVSLTDLLAEIKDRWPSVAVVMVSGHGDAHTGFEAARRGAYEFLEKPLAEERVLLTVRNAATLISVPTP